MAINERLYRFDAAILQGAPANAGVYEVAGNLVTIRPIVAKIPVVMKPGAYEVYAFLVDNNTLSLTQQRNVRGPVEGRAATKLVRLE